jgi:hypothetical protein
MKGGGLVTAFASAVSARRSCIALNSTIVLQHCTELYVNMNR